MTIIKKALFCFVFCLICCGLYSKEDQRSNAKYVMVVSGKMKMKKKNSRINCGFLWLKVQILNHHRHYNRLMI